MSTIRRILGFFHFVAILHFSILLLKEKREIDPFQTSYGKIKGHQLRFEEKIGQVTGHSSNIPLARSMLNKQLKFSGGRVTATSLMNVIWSAIASRYMHYRTQLLDIS